MGRLTLAGVAGGIGKSMQRSVAYNRQMELDEAEREHQRQLEAMRDAHARERMDIQYERDLGMAETQRTHQLGMAETRAEHEFGLQMNDQALQVWKTNADNESDEWQAAFGSFMRSTSGAAGTTRKAGEWDVEFTEIFDVTTGQTKAGMRASHPNGTAIEQHGTRMIPVSLSDEDKLRALAPWKDEQKRLEAETKLLRDLRDGNDSSEWFLESFGYLPASYYRAKFEMSDDSRIKEFMESFKRSRTGPEMPYQYGGQMPRSTPDRIGGTTPERNMPPAEDGGAVDEAKVAEMRRNEGVESGAGDDPYVVNLDGSRTYLNEAPQVKAQQEDQASRAEAMRQAEGGGGGALTTAATLPEASTGPTTPTPKPEETPEKQPGLVVTQEGEVTEEQAQQIADAVASIMQGKPPGPTWGERTVGGIKDWLTGGYSGELNMYITGSEKSEMERKYGPRWTENDKAIAELRARKGK